MTEKSISVKHLSLPLQGILLMLSILAIVVPCVLGFVNFDKRVDIVEEDVSRIEIDVEANEDEIQELQLDDKGLQVQYGEILRRLDEQGTILREMAK